jgi:hypothetical protein
VTRRRARDHSEGLTTIAIMTKSALTILAVASTLVLSAAVRANARRPFLVEKRAYSPA